jgi:hypothetical protein
MSAVSERLCAELLERFQRLPLEERIARVLELGQRDVSLYSDARGVDRRTASRVFAAARRRGRRYSGCLEPDRD